MTPEIQQSISNIAQIFEDAKKLSREMDEVIAEAKRRREDILKK